MNPVAPVTKIMPMIIAEALRQPVQQGNALNRL